MLWITIIAHSFYIDQIGYLLSPSPNIVAALLFYLIYIAGMLYFVTLPSLKAKGLSPIRVYWAGGFFGLVAYSVYDLTSLATVMHWPLLITIIDMLWGLFDTGITALIGYLYARKAL